MRLLGPNTVWEANQPFTFTQGYTGAAFSILPLDPSVAFANVDTAAPPLKPGTPVTVTIEPRDFEGPDWRIAVEQTFGRG